MPQVTVYVRDEDVDAWRGIVKKSEFIHNALQNLNTYDGAPIVLREMIPEPRKPMDMEKAGIATLCKHGAHPDYCKFKSQGKPCK